MSKKLEKEEVEFTEMFKKLLQLVNEDTQSTLDLQAKVDELEYNIEEREKDVEDIYNQNKQLTKEIETLKKEIKKIKFFDKNPKGYCLNYESDIPFLPPVFAYYYRDLFIETSLEDVISVLEETEKYYILEVIFPNYENDFIKFVPNDKLNTDFKETNIIKLNKLSGDYIDITKEWKEKEELKKKLSRKPKEKE